MSKEGTTSPQNNETDHAFHQMGNKNDCHFDLRKLPLKRRLGATLVNEGFNGKKVAEPFHSNSIPKQVGNLKTVHIFPGVIRHTSNPDTSLAYYYKYHSL